MNLFGAVILYEGMIYAKENIERRVVYYRAETEAYQLGIPLIVVGCPKWGLHHGHGDATVDIKHPGWCRCPNPITMDVRDVDKHLPPQSVVVFSSHVLEHLTPEIGQEAVRAMDTVAVVQYHVWPSRMSISAWLAPTHKSWPRVEGNEIVFEGRKGG